MNTPSIDSTMEELFRLESSERLRNISDAMLGLEQTATPEALKHLMREAHSLKGACGMMQLQPWVKVAHQLEDVFERFASEQRAPLRTEADTILQVIDTFQRVTTVPLEALLQPENNPYSQQALTLQQNLSTLFDRTSAPAQEPESDPRRCQTLSTALEPQPSVEKIERTSSTWVRNETLHALSGLAGEGLVLAKALPAIVRELRAACRRRPSQQTAADAGSVVDSNANDSLSALVDRLEEHATRNARVAAQFYHEALSCKLRPFSDLQSSLTRLVRDLSHSLGKACQLELVGGDTLLDRDILQQLDGLLVHVLRNALDHGIEAAEQRSAAGKSPVGLLRITCGHRNGRLQIRVEDDGRGLARELLEQTVVTKGLSTQELCAQMNASELYSFLFLPGFSTREEVSAVSGRGVGLDAVQNILQKLGGSVRVSSIPGSSMCFEFDVPVSRSIVKALVMRIGGELFALPLAQLLGTLTLPQSDVRRVGNVPSILWQDQSVILSCAHEVLALAPSAVASATLSVVLLEENGRTCGLVVDQFLSHQELTVQSLESYFGAGDLQTSAAIDEQGRVIVLLDAGKLVSQMNMRQHSQSLQLASPASAQASLPAAKRVLVVDDSITVRELERKLLRSQGFEVQAASDGLEAWSLLKTQHFALVVSDVDMPHMNGFELVQRLKSSDKHRQIPVIIVSYKERDQDRARGLEVGADYYLTKSSFHDASFIQAVHSLIGEEA